MNVTKEQLQEIMSDITLAHMEAPVPEDFMIHPDYPEAGKDFALYIVQRHYAIILKRIQDDHKANHGELPKLDKYMAERILVMAKTAAIQWFVGYAHELVDRATAFLLQDAERSLIQSDHFGWDNLEDFLASIADAQTEGTGTYLAWITIQKEIKPACQGFGIDPGLLFVATANARKVTRGLVPAWNLLREQMKSGEVSPEKGKEVLKEWITSATNLNEPSSAFQQRVDEYRRRFVEIRSAKLPEPIKADVYAMPENEKWVLMRLNGNQEIAFRMIVQALKGRVEFDHKNMAEFLSLGPKIMEEIRGKER